MKVSLEWISDFVDLPDDVSPTQLAHDLTLKTVEVENIVEVDGDVILEIDNKSLTNRPDLWGHYGIAREFAVIYGLPLRPLPSADRPEAVDGLTGTLDPALCHRLAAMEFTVAGPDPTPSYIEDRLRRIGEGTVSLCVDLSNYVMFTVGQPTHVYDSDRLTLPLSVVAGDTPSTLELLNGQKAELIESTPVVRDATSAVAVAGVMGSSATAVDVASRRFVLEAATFRPGHVRRTTQRLGVRTEASARFEKALDTQRVDQAIDMFLHLLRDAAPGAIVSGMQDVTIEPTAPAQVELTREFLDRRIGESLKTSELQSTLTALGFHAEINDTALRVTAPTWRSTGDISLPHDILEEVARIHGYDRLPVAQTSVTLQPVRSRNRISVDRAIREALASRSGLQEVITYPWAPDHLVRAVGFAQEQTVRFEGMPAPDRGSLRPSLVPGLLETVTTNLRYTREFGIFEIGTVFDGGTPQPYKGKHESLPPMRKMLGIALVGDDGAALFRRAKGIVDLVRRHCHLIDLRCEGDSDSVWADRSARVAITADETRVGTLALLPPRIRRLAEIDGVQVACIELDLSEVRMQTSRHNAFKPIPELPDADFDLSVVIADGVAWERIEQTTRGVDELISGVSYVGEFRDSWVPQGHRSLTLRVTLRPFTTTFTSESIGAVRTNVLKALQGAFGAHLR
ncbi:phenylalanine--tRNA ligase subunit beta [Streptomyces sp. CC219B]|uniref:phenylalanine--tRNA ligase subunit beta n=1 Tax=Streptomyces sp. CC219B TaxID=3044574 RepID=UPI0024A87333|nr:phenylalanine--tRNA ligase subunit beta [Streptomyces sp. CC219B]